MLFCLVMQAEKRTKVTKPAISGPKVWPLFQGNLSHREYSELVEAIKETISFQHTCYHRKRVLPQA